MSRIEKGITHDRARVEIGLHALHQENRDAEQQQSSSSSSPHPPPTTVAPQLIPFALVNSVAESSPAAEAVRRFLYMTNSRDYNRMTRSLNSERVMLTIMQN
jgi:hypothetical protein